MLATSLIERIMEHWGDYKICVDASMLISLLEELHLDISWTADAITPQSAVALLVGNVTSTRLQLIKSSMSVDPEIATAVLPLLKHLLDNPSVTIRRLAIECIAYIDSSITSMYSPLPFRYQHVIKSLLKEPR
jgi:hypothetical protein